MQVHLLEAFIVLAEELNYRRAADRLAVSQPGLTTQIQRLEHQLGGRLFLRGRRGTQLSPLGTELLPLARAAVAAVGQIQAVAGGHAVHQHVVRRSLRVGLLGDALGPLTWPLLRAFAHERPDVEIVLVQMGFVDAFHAIDQGRADVVMATGPLSRTEHQDVATVGTESIAALFTAGHPLAGAPTADLERVALSLTYDTPVGADPAFRRFWLQEDLRERAPRHASQLRAPPDGPVLDDLVHRVGAVGGVGLWPGSIPISDASGCVVRPLAQPLTAPRQLVVLRSDEHARALMRIGLQLADASVAAD